MTAVAERIAPGELAPGHRRQRIRPNRALVSLIALVVLLVTGLAGYAARVATGQLTSSYPVPSAAATSSRWVQAESPSAAAWFRATPTLADDPVSATLWVDARDTYRLWINGRVAATNRAAARAGASPIGAAVDVRSLMKAGPNVVAVQVSGLGEQTAALWVRLMVRLSNGQSVEYGSGTDSWKATSNAALSGSALGDQPRFIEADYPTSGWTRPVGIEPVRTVTTPIPAAVIGSASAPSDLTAVSASGFDGVYRLELTAPGGTADSWLRVAATGALTVSVNGHVVANRPAPEYVSPNSHRAAQLWLIHLGPILHSGSNSLVFRATATRTTTVAMDAFALSGRGWSKLNSDDGRWSVVTAGQANAVTTLNPAAANLTWTNGFTSTILAPGQSPVPWRAFALGAFGALIVVLGLISVVRRRYAGYDGYDPGQAAVGRVVLVLAPGVAVIAAALAIGRWVTLSPGFAYRPAVAATAVGVALLVPVSAGIRSLATARRSRQASLHLASPSDAELDALLAPTLRRRIWTRTFGHLAWATPSRMAVIALTAASTFAESWRLGRQPVWQDEATSLQVARSIHDHGLPQLNSGLYYFKAELYHAIIAGVLVFSDSTTVLRAVSLVWFAATVLAFGLLLMPLLTNRPSLIVIATALLVVVPAELVWARDIRMYQQMQFFAVVFLALFIRALRDGARRDIILSAAALLAMYLSHEESFVILPAVPLAALIVNKSVWLNRGTYLRAYGPVFVIIAAQYLISHIHPVDFGEDLSNRPYVGWDPNQADFYYQRIFFAPLEGASLAILSTLALIGIAAAIRGRRLAPALLGLTLVTTVAATSLLFTAKVDRYSFIAVPMVVALAVMGGAWLSDLLMAWCTGHRRRPDQGVARQPRRVRYAVRLTAVGLLAATLATLVVSPRGFGLLVADATSSPNPLTHSDYQSTVGYLRDHIQPGDQVITLSPPVMTELYLGRRPDRVIQTGRNKLLYLVLRDGQAVDTLLGVPVLLTGPQLRVYLEAHPRVWLVSDTGSYIQGIPPDVKEQISTSFQIVSQNATTTLSLWNTG
jgi:hypothetical protein